MRALLAAGAPQSSAARAPHLRRGFAARARDPWVRFVGAPRSSRREHTTRPNVSHIDFDVTGRIHVEVWPGRPESPRRSSGLLSSDPSAHGRAPLAAAAARGHEPVVAALLGGAGARAATPAALVAAAAAAEAGCVAALARAAAPKSGAAPARAAAARGHAAALEALAAEPATRAGLGAATAEGETPAHLAARAAVCKSNLQPDFNVRVCECFDTSTSAVLRELAESNRFVQKSAESTSI